MANSTVSPSDEDQSTPNDEALEASAEESTLEEATPEEVAPEETSAPAEPDILAPTTIIERRRGPGFISLVLGGVIAAGLGWGATYMGYLPAPGTDQSALESQINALSDSLAEQGTALTAVETRAGSLETALAALPAAPEPVDLTPLSTQIEALGSQIAATSETVNGLTDRVTFLETLPAGDGEGGNNSAATAAAVAQMRAALQEQSAALEAQQAQNAALAEQISAMATEAETRIAAAEARAEARVGGVTAQVAMGQLSLAMASGAPFAEALNDIVETTGIEPPEALLAAAAEGVTTIEELQASFPAAARAALPAAINAEAADDESAGNRFMAFLRSQVGGRSLEPREGDDPDAVLSRAEAAIGAGDIAGALTELAALPNPALDALADWTEAATTTLGAGDALEFFAASLDNEN